MKHDGYYAVQVIFHTSLVKIGHKEVFCNPAYSDLCSKAVSPKKVIVYIYIVSDMIDGYYASGYCIRIVYGAGYE